jgi:cytidyltransferase-like protein
LIFPGSFNPVHEGHIKVAEKACVREGKPVWFEISLTNCSKPIVDWVSLQERIASFDAYKNTAAIAGFIFTNEPLFVRKARLFTEPIFVVGRDTLARVDNPAFYDSKNDYSDAINEMGNRNTHFLVFDRKGAPPLPFRHLGLEKICTIVDGYTDVGENSTDVRRQDA